MTDNTQKKAELLSNPVKHIDVTSFDGREIINAWENMSFTSRDAARAARILQAAQADENCAIILTLAGSTSAGGCLHVWRDMVRYNMVDAIVATGASIVDMDFFEALGFKHYQAKDIPDDRVLRDLYIDRIYDTYIDEDELQACDHTITEIAKNLTAKPISSRAFIQAMGQWLADGNAKKQGSLIEECYRHGVPIFVPAFSDCSAGFGLVKHQVQRMESNQPYLSIDSVADFRELTEIKIKAGSTGLFMIGGGVPKNFAQDIVVCAEILGHDNVEMHKYAVQITVADVRDGACSSSTLKEACSWGKVDVALEQMVYAEATTVAPIIVSDIFHHATRRNRTRYRFADMFEN